MFRAALNEAFFDNSSKCGICYELTGPDGAIRIMATDLCPVKGNEAACSGDMFHFDLGANAIPYLFDPITIAANVSFRMVACDVIGNIKIRTFATYNNDWFLSFTVTNHVIGVKSADLSFDDGETFFSIERHEANNFCYYPDSKIQTPFKIKITSIADEELVIEMNSFKEDKYFDSGVQFSIPDNFFDIETLEPIPKPDDVVKCCDQPDDIDTIYDDDILGIWSETGVNNTDTIYYTDNPYKGSYCLKTDLKQWGGLQFWGKYAVDSKLYTNLTFYVKTDSAADNCLFVMTDSTTGEGKLISIDEANQWQYFDIPLEELGSGDTFQTFIFQNRLTAMTFYFDEVRLIPSNIDTSICADKYLSSGIKTSIISIIIIILVIII